MADLTLLAGIYGQKGTLKSTTWMLAPEEFRPIAVLDADRAAGLRLAGLAMPEERRKALGAPASLSGVGPHLKNGVSIHVPKRVIAFEDSLHWAAEEGAKAKLAVIDTANHLGLDFLSQVAREGAAAGMGEQRFILGQGNERSINPNRSDYMLAQDRVMKVIERLDDAPCHVLIICHESTVEIALNEDTKRVIAGPRLVTKPSAEWFPRYLDVLLRFKTKTTITSDGKLKNAISVFSSNQDSGSALYIAGDRSGLFDVEEELDPKRLWARFSALIDMAKGE